MSDMAAYNELTQLLARRVIYIKGMLVTRATHELLDRDLDAASQLEGRLISEGYRRTGRGDWVLD